MRNEIRQEDGKLKRKKQTAKITKQEEVKHVSIAKNDAPAEYQRETQKYTELHKVQAKKGPEREEMTLNLLAKFQAKLHAAKSLVGVCSYEEKKVETKDGKEEEDDDLSWMRHKLIF